jgi:Fe-S cluster biogenesis protein NfuA
MAVRPAKSLVFSTYDYGLAAGDNPPLPTTVMLDDTVIVGLGGIGSALVAAMSSLSAIAGDIALVDHDALDETNLNRFLIARPGDAGPKVELCRRALAFHSGIQVYPEEFEAFIKGQTSNHSFAVVGVDKDRVRRAIQSAMPRLIFNAGTSDLGSFRVTRHDYMHGACLSCISRDDMDSHPVERELSRRLGIDLQTVLDYQRTGEPLPVELLARSGALNPTAAEDLGNHSIAEIHQRLCGQVALGANHSEPAMSISFLSALPGFLLLGELIKEQNYPQLVRPPLNAQVNHAFFSVIGRLHPKLLHGWREKQEECDCRRAAYQRKWG